MPGLAARRTALAAPREQGLRRLPGVGPATGRATSGLFHRAEGTGQGPTSTEVRERHRVEGCRGWMPGHCPEAGQATQSCGHPLGQPKMAPKRRRRSVASLPRGCWDNTRLLCGVGGTKSVLKMLSLYY